jgi:tetratricopeptide (TPR) repeat protein
MMDSTALRLLQDALALQEDKDSVLRARLLAYFARASEGQRPHAELLAILDESVAMARRLGEPGALIDCARLRFSFDRDPGRVHERLALGRELIALSHEVEDKNLRSQLLVFHSYDCAAVADLEGWQSSLDAVDRLARELGDPFNTYNACAMRAALPLMAGRFDEAERLSMEAFETGKRLGVDNVEGVMGVQMFTIRREQGRLAELAPVVRHFVNDRGAGAAWRPGLALVYADLGDCAAARREFEDLAAGEFAVVPRDALWQTCLCYLAEVCAALGDRERAAWLYEQLEPYRDLAVVVGNTTTCLGATARYLGMLAVLLGREDMAVALFERALEIEQRMGAEVWMAHTRLHLADLLEAQGGTERLSWAESLRSDAIAAARQGGFARILRSRRESQ